MVSSLATMKVLSLFNLPSHFSLSSGAIGDKRGDITSISTVPFVTKAKYRTEMLLYSCSTKAKLFTLYYRCGEFNSCRVNAQKFSTLFNPVQKRPKCVCVLNTLA